ncbi:MAG: matrixin family metalloprotease [Holophagales bacterium]|nr:matrixin family metalloprotease [Holophagales bacterium]MXX76254.1 matrixin family metalloprotease [Holophagales bacterium]MYD22747.1 matrixin family metalloprotease [Holophagales bacterium]MYF96140.1 matrixin family metalloprotease [Holophagales bacterium]
MLVADADDERVAMVAEAVSFWNGTVSELGLAGPFSEPGHQAPPEELRPFENYAHQLSQLAGRLDSSTPGPQPPEALLRVDAEVVVLLSAQSLMPFAWPYGDDGRYFVAIPSGDERDNVVRNVIAHEFGHVLGLKHIRQPGVLMCQPCDTSARSSNHPRFLPLTDLDRERLRSFLGGTEP